MRAGRAAAVAGIDIHKYSTTLTYYNNNRTRVGQSPRTPRDATYARDGTQQIPFKNNNFPLIWSVRRRLTLLRVGLGRKKGIRDDERSERDFG